MTIREAKLFGCRELCLSPTPALDVDCILQNIMNMDRTRLLLARSSILSPAQEKQFLENIAQRKTGFPIAYITEKKEFYGLEFYVNPSVLIPKPDTEILIEKALNLFDKKYIFEQSLFSAENFSVCDMCSGSGCVGISFVHSLAQKYKVFAENLPRTVFADISESALKVSEKNVRKIFGNAGSFSFVNTNLFEKISSKFSVILTNPPYVPHSQSVELLQDGRSEPLSALDGDVDKDGKLTGLEDGLAIIKRLVPLSFEHLFEGGLLVMETGEYNACETAEIFKNSGFTDVEITLDLNGMKRIVSGQKKC